MATTHNGTNYVDQRNINDVGSNIQNEITIHEFFGRKKSTFILNALEGQRKNHHWLSKPHGSRDSNSGERKGKTGERKRKKRNLVRVKF